ncbi:MAG TPA: CHAT domain-containing tetratricopeptide repeat protein [Stellaceae bacterium]|nr:CHAT domain-containing tetratricopeptide repeat protein [Stellaceae bacterium]
MSPALRPPRAGLLALAAALGLALAACETLPPDVLVKSAAMRKVEEVKQVGNDQVGEPCNYRQDSPEGSGVLAKASYSVRCGTWQQPSGHVYEAVERRDGLAALRQLATASPWRSHLDQILNCGAPAETRILDEVPAVLMQCTRRNGGWPHLAFATTLEGKTLMVDGVMSSLPALEATVAAIAGRPIAGTTQRRSAAYELLAEQFAKQPFGSGDLERYYGLMRLGDEANAIDNFAAAEDAFRDALAVQQRILGPSNPGLAMPLMHLGLQISNQGRFAEADGFFARAAALLGPSPDPLVSARLQFYLAIHEANQGEMAKAADRVAGAERVFAAYVPSGMLAAARRGDSGAGSRRGASGGSYDSLFLDPDSAMGILGLSSIWRFEGMLAYRAGRYDDAKRLAEQSKALIAVSGTDVGGVLPRVVRVAALSDAGAGEFVAAAKAFSESVQLFNQVIPNERPVAVTLFLAGRESLKQGKIDRALRRFRRGAKILRDRHLGLPEVLVTPYLETLFAVAESDKQAAAPLYAEMFEASQLIQSGLTAQYIAKAAARLAAGDQRVSATLRQLQQAELELKNLFVARDAEAQKPAPLQSDAELARIDAAIAAAEAKRDEAEAAAQAAAPAYGQLVQADAAAITVAKLLRPQEALLAIQLGRSASFGFLVTPTHVTAYRIPLTLAEATAAVDHLRKTAQVFFTAAGVPQIPIYDLAAANRLYATLFGPVEAELKPFTHLVIAPNGPLLSLPFEMLVTAPTAAVTNGDYRAVPFLLKRFATSYVPAPQTFVNLRRIKSASSAPLPFIGFGDFRPASDAQLAAAFPPDRCKEDYEALRALPTLPGTREEVTGIGRLLGARPQDIYLGDAFTRAAIDKIDFSRYRIIHFATHAFLPTELHCKTEPSILTSVPKDAASAAGAFLEGGEILKLQMDADLVILSACNTAGPAGTGSGGGGESLSGLARAFFFAGTRGLLVTHWSVDDDSAEFITTSTVRAMRPGTGQEDTVDALRQAKLDRLAGIGAAPGSGTLFSHPFAWAPFVLIGDGLRLSSTPASS